MYISTSEFLNETGSLTLPLDPSRHHDIEQQITFGEGVRTRGIELIASIATRAWRYWEDTRNLRIRGKIDDRRLPFRNFEFITQPAGGTAVLNPLKLGVVSCWIMKKVVEGTSWPGEIDAIVYDATQGDRYHKLVGTLTIANDPIAGSPAPATIVNAFEKELFDGVATPLTTADVGISPPASSLGSSETLERRWLSCYTSLFYYGLKFSPDDSVRYNMHDQVAPPGSPVTLRFPCTANKGVAKQYDILNMYSYPTEGPNAVPDLKWGELMPQLLDWITLVAEKRVTWWAAHFVPPSQTQKPIKTTQLQLRIILGTDGP